MKNRPSITRRCAHCGDRFIVNPRVGARHRFCGKPICARASKQAAQRKWLRKNGDHDYFAGKPAALRVRRWRQETPKYWNGETRVLAAKASTGTLTRRLAAALRFVTLQDTIDTRVALLVGIISHLTGATLQDAIASALRKLILRGNVILRAESPPR